MAGKHAAPGWEQPPAVRVTIRRPPRQPRTGQGLLVGLVCLVLAVMFMPEDVNAASPLEQMIPMGLALITVMCWWPPRT